MFLKKALAVAVLSAPILAITGCGGDDSTAGGNTNTNSAALTLALTDGPVDSATAVVVEITGVSIKPKEGEVIAVEFDAPRSVDLLQLQDGVVTDLVNELELAAGEYAWVELHLNAVKDGVMDSYVEFEDGTSVELDMPGESARGLRIARSFTLAEGEGATFTIDFDLRKSLVRHVDRPDVTLKPVLHMMPNHRAGHLHGELDAALVAEMCADPSVELGAVYVYAGADAVPTDVNGSEADPVASALVKLAPHGEYRYRIGFLEAGEYTVAYTCDAASDNPEEVNELNFAVLEPITVEARAEHEHPFPPTTPHEMWDESVCDRILDTESSEEETVTEGEDDSTETSVRPIPPHLQHWCETGEHEWHPRPGRGDDENGEPVDPSIPPMDDVENPEQPGDRPQPPTRGDDEMDEDDDGDVTDEQGEDEEATDPVV
jgi:hypothetical protein